MYYLVDHCTRIIAAVNVILDLSCYFSPIPDPVATGLFECVYTTKFPESAVVCDRRFVHFFPRFYPHLSASTVDSAPTRTYSTVPTARQHIFPAVIRNSDYRVISPYVF